MLTCSSLQLEDWEHCLDFSFWAVLMTCLAVKFVSDCGVSCNEAKKAGKKHDGDTMQATEQAFLDTLLREKALLQELSTNPPLTPSDQRAVTLLFYTLVRRRRELETRFWLEADSSPLKATKKFLHLVRRQPVKRKRVHARRAVQLERAGPLLSREFDLYKQTGLFMKEFYKIVECVKEDITRPRAGSKSLQVRSNSLAIEPRVAVVLSVLRRGMDSKDAICKDYGVSGSYLSREFKHGVPILASNCTFISPTIEWPKEHQFERVVGAIDCTSHYRVRVHPHQIDFYRGDKKGFFLSAQVVADLSGKILDASIFPGRVVDQVAFKNTLQEQLSKDKKFLLADSGYHDIQLVTPLNDAPHEWNNVQKALRSVIEHLNSCVHCFRYASQRIRGHSPELQAFALLVIYNIVSIMQRRLRSEGFLGQFPASNCWCADFATLSSLNSDTI